MRPFRTRSRAALAALVACLAIALGLAGASGALAGDHRPSRPPTRADQIPNLGLVKNQIKQYYGDTGTGQASPTSPYALEVARVERRIESTLRHPGRTTGTPAIVLDVDDTSLLTYNYEAAYDFGYIPSANAEYVLGERFPAVFGMVDVARYAVDHGYALFFLTGRPDTQQAATEGNLDKVGYPTPKQVFTKDRTAPYPAYLPCSPTCTTVQYKAGTRAYIESMGYDIVVNVGDQYTDLEGGYADRTFKLPNPMYFIA